MLRELHLQNLAVLAGADVEFDGGLNVLTGETGAGKSIVLDALALLAGGRARAELIRSGAASLSVTGVFETSRRPGSEPPEWLRLLDEAGIECESEGVLLVRREVNRDGRNRLFLNDQPATARLLAELSPQLLRLHGQREELGLVAPDLQRAWLDRSGGEAAVPLQVAVRDAHARFRTACERRDRSSMDVRLREERLDLVRFQLGEIDGARLVAGEDDELRAERDRLRHVEAISEALGGALANLVDDEGAAVDRLAQTGHRLRDVSAWETHAEAWAGEAEELRIRTRELADEIRHRLDGVEADPRRLDWVEERLAVIERLTRKHGTSVDEVLRRRALMAEELAGLENDSSTAEELEARAAEALATYRAAAAELSTARRAWGDGLAERVVAELRDLALPNAVFSVELANDDAGERTAPQGSDRVSFQFSPNPGEAPRALGRVASGGELSRVYLALQLAVGYGDGGAGEELPTLVFDEIDAGMGGAEGFALGAKLRRLARAGQILAVTHLPQVAAQGDAHFLVKKDVRGDRTFASVEALSADERVEEVARMLSGAVITGSSRDHARELIALATAPAGRRTSKRRRA